MLIFAEACLVVPAWTRDNACALETPGVWLNVNGRGGTRDSKVAVHSYGIFATDPVVFAPGDICVIPRANHYFIVIEAPEGSEAVSPGTAASSRSSGRPTAAARW